METIAVLVAASFWGSLAGGTLYCALDGRPVGAGICLGVLLTTVLTAVGFAEKSR